MRKEMLLAGRVVCEILPRTGDSSPGSTQLKLLAEDFTVMYGVIMWGLPANVWLLCLHLHLDGQASTPVKYVSYAQPLLKPCRLHQPVLCGARGPEWAGVAQGTRVAVLAGEADATGSTGKCVFVSWLSLCVIKVTFTRGHFYKCVKNLD